MVDKSRFQCGAGCTVALAATLVLGGCASSPATDPVGGSTVSTASVSSHPAARYVGPITRPYRLNGGTIHLRVPHDSPGIDWRVALSGRASRCGP